MALLDRVSTLIKANVNDLVDKAEQPEKLLKQLLLDMQNQFMQVKTQLAISIADQHLLEKRQQENLGAQQEWLRKAELAVQANQDDLARVALQRSVSFETTGHNYSQQVEDQAQQVRSLKDALHRLEQKMTETRAKAELLLAQNRRARVAVKAGLPAVAEMEHDATFDRMRLKVAETEAMGYGLNTAFEPSVETRFAELEKDAKVDRLLSDLKSRAAGKQTLIGPGGQ
jgi:phage shock protein A